MTASSQYSKPSSRLAGVPSKLMRPYPVFSNRYFNQLLIWQFQIVWKIITTILTILSAIFTSRVRQEPVPAKESLRGGCKIKAKLCHDFSKDEQPMPETAFAVTPPNKIDVSHEGCSPLRLMQSAKVSIGLLLASGIRRIPGIGLGIASGKDTNALLEVTVSRNAMESVKVMLTKPVALYDIKRALRNYNDIAARPQRRSFRGRVLSLATWGFEIMERLGIVICLSSARSLPSLSTHGALRLSFSGFVSFAGGLIRLPFRNIVVPEEIIPLPLARLDLVGYFATAAGNHMCVQSNHSKVKMEEEPDEFVRMLSDLVVEAKFSAVSRFLVPEVEIATIMGDLSVITTKIFQKAGESKVLYMRAAATYHSDCGDGGMSISLDELKLREDSASILKARWTGSKVDRLRKDAPLMGKLSVEMSGVSMLSQSAEMVVEYCNPVVKGCVHCPIEISNLAISGTTELRVEASSIAKLLDDITENVKIEPDVHLEYSSTLSLSKGLIDDGLAKVYGSARNFEICGRIEADEKTLETSEWVVISAVARTDNAFPFAVSTVVPLPVFPELNMSSSDKVTIAGSARLTASGAFRVSKKGVTCDDSVVDVEVSNPVRAKFLRREVVLPSRTHLKALIRMLHVGYDGLAQTDMVLVLDETYLHFSGCDGDGTAALRLRPVTLPISISPVGGLDCGETIIGALLRPDIRGAVFLNTMEKVRAGQEDEFLRGLRDDLDGVIKVLVPSLHSFIWRIVDEVKRAKRVLEEEKVTAPLDVIPNSKLGRLVSLILFKDDSRTQRISSIVQQVTEGDGLDKTACRELIEEWKKMFLPLKITAGCEAEEGSSNSEDSTDGGEMEANPLWQRYELDPTEFILFVLGKILAPTEPIEAPGLKPPKWQDPVSTDPSIRVEGLDRLPSASDLYNGDRRAADVATYLRTAQVAWLLEHADEFGYSHEEKRKLDIFENYGGLAFVPQSRVVGLFLADVARVEQELAKRQGFDSMKAALEWQQLREEAASERERSTSADIGRSSSGDTLELRSARSGSVSDGYSTCSSGEGEDSTMEEEPQFTEGGFIPQGFLHRMTLQMKPVDHEALLRGSLRSSAQSVPVPSKGASLSKSTLPDVAACRWLGMPFTLLGPGDVASMLASCLAAPWAGAVVQSNTRMLLEVLLQKQQPREYVIAVLCESSQNGSARALTNILMRLLEIPQDRTIQRMDVAALLEEKLGYSVPRRTDYMAGGKKPRDSYYHACNVLASKILKENMDQYLAVKNRLTVCYRVQATAPFTEETRGLEEAAIAAIAVTRRPEATRDDFEEAFEACRMAIGSDRRIVDRDWCKEFMLRSYETFMVLSIYDEVVGDVEQSRGWLMVLAGTEELPEDPVDLARYGIGPFCDRDIFNLIRSVYRYEEDRERILNDPLTKLMLRNPKGHVKLALVSAMGVISEGAEGTELAETFHRMHEKRGLQVVRADTGTGRSLEYNARRVIEAIRKIDGDTEWGWLGYSQGCANALRAETTIQTGTPEEYELIQDRLIGRMLIFSAFNGSVHGQLGDDKVQAVIMDLEYFMKLLQAHFSSQLAGSALNLLTSALASRLVTDLLVGVQSLTHEGVFTLWRDGQFKQSTPTVAMRGAVQSNVTLPEVLEMLSNMLTKQTINHEHHDTQVTIHECVSRSIHVRNSHTDVFARSGVDAAVQRTHHWSPLLKESAFVTTERDRERHVYDTAKDRHVEPWLENLIRFGLVPFAAEE